MEMRKLIQTTELAETLKNNTRHSQTSKGRHEDVVEHSWRLYLFVYFTRDEFLEADMDRAFHVHLFHDMREASTGDIPSFQKTEADEIREVQMVCEWVDSLSAPYDMELHAPYGEMDALEILEARIYKALDRMKALMWYNQSDLSTWFSPEYELNLKCGVEQAEFHDYLRRPRQMVSDDRVTRVKREDPEKYRKLGWEQPWHGGFPVVRGSGGFFVSRITYIEKMTKTKAFSEEKWK